MTLRLFSLDEHAYTDMLTVQIENRKPTRASHTNA